MMDDFIKLKRKCDVNVNIFEKQFDRLFPEIISNIGNKMRSIDKYLDFFRRTLIYLSTCA